MILFLPLETALPWSIGLLGLFVTTRVLHRIEVCLSEEYRESLANRQAMGWVYGLVLAIGIGAGVLGAWALRTRAPAVGLSSQEQLDRSGALLQGQFRALHEDLRGIREDLRGVHDRLDGLRQRVDTLPAAIRVPYEGPTSQTMEQQFQLSRDAVQGDLQVIKEILGRVEKSLEVRNESRRQ